MKRTKFSRWLDKQRHRPDPVGDLAREAQHDPRTHTLEDLEAWLDFLVLVVRACHGAEVAARQAWQEFRKHEALR